MGSNKDKLILAIIGAIVVFSVVAFMVMTYAVSRSGDGLAIARFGGKVALVDLKGVIRDSESVVRQLKKYQEDSSVKAIVLRIDSPGGAVAPSQEIYDQVIKFKTSGKRVVASMGSVAASGGYYVACAADTIFANPGTLTGSIGVIFTFPVFEGLMDKVGIKTEVVKSGELKDVGSPSHRMTPKERRMLQSVIDDTYEQFVEVVAQNRGLETDYVEKLADGSVFTGRQAAQKGLVDRLGTLEDAIAAAGRMTHLGENPRVIRERRLKHRWWELLTEVLGLNFAGRLHPWPRLEYLLSF